jgi:hypothetical protein
MRISVPSMLFWMFRILHSTIASACFVVHVRGLLEPTSMRSRLMEATETSKYGPRAVWNVPGQKRAVHARQSNRRPSSYVPDLGMRERDRASSSYGHSFWNRECGPHVSSPDLKPARACAKVHSMLVHFLVPLALIHPALFSDVILGLVWGR